MCRHLRAASSNDVSEIFATQYKVVPHPAHSLVKEASVKNRAIKIFLPPLQSRLPPNCSQAASTFLQKSQCTRLPPWSLYIDGYRHFHEIVLLWRTLESISKRLPICASVRESRHALLSYFDSVGGARIWSKGIWYWTRLRLAWGWDCMLADRYPRKLAGRDKKDFVPQPQIDAKEPSQE